MSLQNSCTFPHFSRVSVAKSEPPVALTTLNVAKGRDVATTVHIVATIAGAGAAGTGWNVVEYSVASRM